MVDRRKHDSGHGWLVVVLVIVSGILTNVVSNFLDNLWHLSAPGRIGLTAGVLAIVAIFMVLLEAGVRIPGLYSYHRFWYLFELTRSGTLRKWATRFAPLHLGRGPRYVAAAEVLKQGERRDLVEVLLDAVSRPGRGRRILILGEPGSGKSTALERLALQLATRSLHWLGMAGPVPVFVRSGDLRSDDDLESLVADAIQKWTRGRARDVLMEPSSIRRVLNEPGLVLLVDALDELTGGRRAALLDTLSAAALSGGMERISIIVTCRTRQDPQDALPEYENYAVLDLSDESIGAFVEIYSREKRVAAEEVYQRLREGTFLEPGGLGRNPFWLKHLIFTGAEEYSRSGILSATSRFALGQEFSKPPTAQRDWVRPADWSNEKLIEVCTRALGTLAVEMDLRKSVSRKQARDALSGWLSAWFTDAETNTLSPEHLLDLARDAGLVERTHDPVSFSHRLLQEYFTAFGLWHDQRSPGPWLSSYRDDPGRWQTLSLYAGLVSPADRDNLVRAILASEGTPARLASAIAVYVGDNRIPEGPFARDLLDQIRNNLMAGADINRDLQESLREFLVMGHNLAAWFLGGLLSDPSATVRERACRLLALSDAQEAVRLLASVGLYDQDDAVGDQAVAALASMGELALWAVIQQLRSEHETARGRSVRVLQKYGNPAAVNYLLRCRVDDEIAGKALTACAGQRVGRLLLALAYGSKGERARAAMALGKVLGPHTTEPLQRAVCDPAPEVRSAAVAALQEWSVRHTATAGTLVTPPLVSALAVALRQKDYLLWSEAADLLVKLNDRQGIKVLVEALADDTDSMRRYAVRSAMEHASGRETIRFLVDSLGDSRSQVRSALVDILDGLPAPDVIPLLLEAATHDNPLAREGAVTFLGRKIGNTALAVTEQNEATDDASVTAAANPVTEVCIRALGDTSERVRAAAVRSLSRSHDLRVTGSLCRMLRDPHPQVRVATVESLAERAEPELQEPLLAALRDEAPAVRRAAASALRPRSTPEVIRGVQALLADEDEEARREALITLIASRSAEVVGAVLHVLSTENTSVRQAVLIGAGWWGDPRFVPFLQTQALGTDPELAEAAIRALDSCASPEATAVIVETLSHKHLHVRWEAATALAKRDGTNVTDALLNAWGTLRGENRSQDSRLARAILQSLAKRQDPRVVTALIQALDDKDPEVVSAAAQALEQQEAAAVTQALIETFPGATNDSVPRLRSWEYMHFLDSLKHGADAKLYQRYQRGIRAIDAGFE